MSVLEYLNQMEPEKWHEVRKPEVLKPYFGRSDFELTFNEGHTMVKKTIWKNGKPI